jgi:hypothetical protein
MYAKPTAALLWISLVVTALPAQAGVKLPGALGYSFYIKGVPAGRCDVKITQNKNELVFESSTRVVTGPDVIAITSRTVADPVTYEIRDFTYKGTKGSHSVSGHAQIKGKSVYGFVEMDGQVADKKLELPTDRNLLFEDWVMDHEILLALTQAASPKKTNVYGLVFTSSFSPVDVTAGFSGDVLVEAGARSMTARKLVVMIRGSDPFESHVDPKQGVPVYIRFPQSQTEAFLEEIFGENPATYYTSKAKAH